MKFVTVLILLCILLYSCTPSFLQKYLSPDDPVIIVKEFLRLGRLGKIDRAIKLINEKQRKELKELHPIFMNKLSLLRALKKNLNNIRKEKKEIIAKLPTESKDISKHEKIVHFIIQLERHVIELENEIKNGVEKTDIKSFLQNRFPKISQAEISLGKPRIKHQQAIVPFKIGRASCRERV